MRKEFSVLIGALSLMVAFGGFMYSLVTSNDAFMWLCIILGLISVINVTRGL